MTRKITFEQDQTATSVVRITIAVPDEITDEQIEHARKQGRLSHPTDFGEEVGYDETIVNVIDSTDWLVNWEVRP